MTPALAEINGIQLQTAALRKANAYLARVKWPMSTRWRTPDGRTIERHVYAKHDDKRFAVSRKKQIGTFRDGSPLYVDRIIGTAGTLRRAMEIH